MGSRVSRSDSASDSARTITAKVVDSSDGSMAQFAAPVAAQEALQVLAAAGAASSSPRFLCCSDELRFDSPVRAMAPSEALHAGQLYFALPLPVLSRPLSGQDMAALAVKASAALGEAPVVVAGAVPSSQDGKAGEDDNGAAGKRRRRPRHTGRVAPLVVVSGHAHGHADGQRESWHSYDAREAAAYRGQTVGKARNEGGHVGAARRLEAVQRLSVIVEAGSE